VQRTKEYPGEVICLNHNISELSDQANIITNRFFSDNNLSEFIPNLWITISGTISPIRARSNLVG